MTRGLPRQYGCNERAVSAPHSQLVAAQVVAHGDADGPGGDVRHAEGGEEAAEELGLGSTVGQQRRTLWRRQAGRQGGAHLRHQSDGYVIVMIYGIHLCRHRWGGSREASGDVMGLLSCHVASPTSRCLTCATARSSSSAPASTCTPQGLNSCSTCGHQSRTSEVQDQPPALLFPRPCQCLAALMPSCSSPRCGRAGSWSCPRPAALYPTGPGRRRTGCH